MASLRLPQLELSRPVATDRKCASQFDTTVAALVVNFSTYPFRQNSLGITRSLGRMGIPVFAIQRTSFVPSGVSRYLAGKFLWRANEKDPDQFLQGMARIGKILSRPTILVPADDFSAILISEHADELPSQFIFARPPANLPRTLANKRCLYDLCHRLGIACPHTVFPHSREELLDLIACMQFPMVVKATEPWLLPENLRSTIIISDRPEIIDYCNNFWRQAPTTNLMIQEMLPAGSSEDWFVHGYCDHRSIPVAMFTGVKLRSYPTFAGPTTLGRSVENDVLREQATQLLSAIGYRGIMDLDYRLDNRDGRYNLLDFNPRIGAQFRLFEDHGGIDVVRALHLDLTGRDVCCGPQIEGRAFISEIHDLLASFSYCRSGNLTVKEWWLSLQGVAERAWWSADDFLPFVMTCLWMPLRAASRLARKFPNA